MRSLFTVFTLGIFLVFSSSLFAQSNENVGSDTTETVEVLSIDQISGETESLRTRLSGLKDVLKPSTKTLEVDSILDSVYFEVIAERDTLYQNTEIYSRRELSIKRVSWRNYKSKLKGLQKTLSGRSSDITRVNDDLLEELARWSATKTTLLENSESEDLFVSLDTMIFTLNDLIDLAHVRLDSVFTVQKRLTELILIVDEAVSEINRIEKLKQKDYFVFDSDPIWVSTVDTAEVDSLIQTKSLRTILVDGVKDDWAQLKNFISQNAVAFGVQLLFLLVIYLILFQMRRRWVSFTHSPTNEISEEVKIIFSHLVSATLVIGILISANFYEALIPFFAEIHIILILVAALIVLPKITNKKLKWVLLILLVVFLIQVLEVYYSPRIFLGRAMTIMKGLLTMAAIIRGIQIVKQYPDQFSKLRQPVRLIAPFYVLMSGISIILNIIGMVNLSDMIINGVFLSTAIGLVVFLAVKIATAVMVLTFKLRQEAKFDGLNHMIEATYQRFQPTLIWIGVFAWIFYTLKGFELYNYLLEWIDDLLEIVWVIGDMKLSLGSILSFFFLFIVSLFLARIVASIFQDKWMIEVLPRGIAPAISLILRIIVISVGVYLAFSAAGLDLSKMGFIFGALGVGIGFGLQNVVLNFIAGLILAFERPINLGDTIEVEMEKGVVTNIGVRSSNIRTFSGSEAIIPNGDLISKKVVNWTLANRDRRSKILMKTTGSADPEMVIDLFNSIAASHPNTYSDPAPKTYFYGYGLDGNLDFTLLYWTTFSDTLKADHEIALEIFKTLKEKGLQAPLPARRIINE